MEDHPSMSIGGINDDVQKAGSEGWELATMWEGIVCFKRASAERETSISRLAGRQVAGIASVRTELERA